MKNAYKISENIVRIDGALLHGDGPTFKDLLGIPPDSFGRDASRNHMEFSLFNFNVENINRVVKLWNDLSVGEPMRCFTPGYRLELYSDNGLFMKTAICWSCNWIQILPKSQSEPDWYSFNGGSETALELLDLIRLNCKKCI